MLKNVFILALMALRNRKYRALTIKKRINSVFIEIPHTGIIFDDRGSNPSGDVIVHSCFPLHLRKLRYFQLPHRSLVQLYYCDRFFLDRAVLFTLKSVIHLTYRPC